jgi:aquaporin related protein
MATLYYALIKHIKYWRLNPDQDVPDPAMSPPSPFERARSYTGSRPDNRMSGEPKSSHDVDHV